MCSLRLNELIALVQSSRAKFMRLLAFSAPSAIGAALAQGLGLRASLVWKTAGGASPSGRVSDRPKER